LKLKTKELENKIKKIGNLSKENKNNKNRIDSLKKDKISASSITRFLKWLLIGIGAIIGGVIVVDYVTSGVHTDKAILAGIGICCAIFAPWFNKIRNLT